MSKKSLAIPYGRAICYSGYRRGQDPRDQTYPTEQQVQEDPSMLQGTWQYLRLYDPSQHAETVLKLIEQQGFNFKVLLGMDLAAEVNNPGCPWGADYSAETLEQNYHLNQQQVAKLVNLVDRYNEHIFAVSIGNEASVDWTDHLVPVDRLIEIAKAVREICDKLITFCENYVPWLGNLDPLVPHLDFLSVHTYPAWEYLSVEDAMAYSRENYWNVADRHPEVPVIITEAGWPTRSNGRSIEPWNATEQLQGIYLPELDTWSSEQQILSFVFEAFDEPWKGSADEDEPEKHWGIYREDRTPKPVVKYFEPKINTSDEPTESGDPKLFESNVQAALLS